MVFKFHGKTFSLQIKKKKKKKILSTLKFIDQNGKCLKWKIFQLNYLKQ